MPNFEVKKRRIKKKRKKNKKDIFLSKILGDSQNEFPVWGDKFFLEFFAFFHIWYYNSYVVEYWHPAHVVAGEKK